MSRRFVAARLAGVLAAVAVGIWLGPAAAPAGAVGVDETCSLALVKIDPNVLNVAYPDQAALYYTVSYAGAPGTQLEIDGVFPHARYMSFTAYDPALRPVDAINDIHISPDPGGQDPFVVGAARNTPVAARHYTVFVQFGPKPAQPAANTIYTGTGQEGPNLAGTLIYRIYIPDQGDDDTGGVGLPTVTLEPAGTHTGAAASSPCTGLSAPPPPVGVNSVLSTANGEPALETDGFTGKNPPVWSKFLNAAYSLTTTATGSFPDTVTAPLDGAAATAGGSGGFLSNLDNAYVYAVLNRGYGQVLVSRMRVASFANTRAGQSPMPAAQLRYWSMCENDPFTERFVACDTDDQTVQRPAGYATYVVSTPAERPANATSACGVNWLPWGADPAGVLILRNMLPQASFRQAVQYATLGQEASTMGAYLPVSRYYSAAGFASLGCAGAATAVQTTTSTFTCAAPSGRLSGRSLGPVTLGETRARTRRAFARVSLRGRRYMDFFCPSHGGIRVGYASPALLRGVSHRRARGVRGRAVLALTANPHYALRGVRAGFRLTAARRHLRLDRGFAIGRNRWYLAPAGPARGILKVRGGSVEEIGIADRSLTVRRLARRFLRSFS